VIRSPRPVSTFLRVRANTPTCRTTTSKRDRSNVRPLPPVARAAGEAVEPLRTVARSSRAVVRVRGGKDGSASGGRPGGKGNAPRWFRLPLARQGEGVRRLPTTARCVPTRVRTLPTDAGSLPANRSAQPTMARSLSPRVSGRRREESGVPTNRRRLHIKIAPCPRTLPRFGPRPPTLNAERVWFQKSGSALRRPARSRAPEPRPQAGWPTATSNLNRCSDNAARPEVSRF